MTGAETIGSARLTLSSEGSRRRHSVVVWKYHIPNEGTFTLEIPGGAAFRGVTVQDGEPYLYAEVSKDCKLRRYVFYQRMTGQELEVTGKTLQYVGWFQIELRSLGGVEVGHVWVDIFPEPSDERR